MENSSLWNGTHANASSTLEACIPWSSAKSITEKALMPTAYIVQIILSLSGNVLVIAVVCKSQQLQKKPVNLFIVNMAASDLFVPFFVIPRRIKEVFLGWYPWQLGGEVGGILCKAIHFVDSMSVAVSSLCMLFIAAERFWSIFLRKEITVVSRKHTPKFIAFTWGFSCLFYSYCFFIYKVAKSKNGLTCDEDVPQIFNTRKEFWIVERTAAFTVFGIIPFIAMTFFYIAIIIKLVGSKKLIALRVPSAAEIKREKHKQRTILMLVTIVLVFFVAWTPFYIYFYHQHVAKTKWPCTSIRAFRTFSVFISHIYTVLNPMIYYVFDKRFRCGLHELCANLREISHFHSTTVLHFHSTTANPDIN